MFLAPCSRLYQLNLLNSYCCYIYNATAVVSNSAPGNRSQNLFCCILKPFRVIKPAATEAPSINGMHGF